MTQLRHIAPRLKQDYKSMSLDELRKLLVDHVGIGNLRERIERNTNTGKPLTYWIEIREVGDRWNMASKTCTLLKEAYIDAIKGQEIVSLGGSILGEESEEEQDLGTYFADKKDKAERERLYILGEECAEVIEIVNKILRFGYDSQNPLAMSYPHGDTNRDMLEKELSHVQNIQAMMSKAKDINQGNIERYEMKKAASIKQYLKHQGEVNARRDSKRTDKKTLNSNTKPRSRSTK